MCKFEKMSPKETKCMEEKSKDTVLEKNHGKVKSKYKSWKCRESQSKSPHIQSINLWQS